MSLRTAFLFPGQGSYVPGVFRDFGRAIPSVRALLDEIDATCAEVGRAPVSELLFDGSAADQEQLVAERPGDLDLAIFASSLAAHEILVSLGVRADVLVGHSFGELAALTAAGALTVADATRFVLCRAQAFADLPPVEGGMVAIGLDGRRTAHLVGLVDDPELVLAVENGPEACVISGPESALDRASSLAGILGVHTIRVPAAQPFHNPLLWRVAEALAARTASLPMGIPRLPVYSAILGRYIDEEADLRLLSACHLIRPVRFYQALQRLHRDGVRSFVESGGRKILTQLTSSGLPRGVRTAVPWDRVATAESVAEVLRSAGLSADPLAAAAVAAPPRSSDRSTAVRPILGQTDTGEAARLVPPGPQAAAGSLAPNRRLPTGQALVAELRICYAECLGFPEELLTDDIDLEADLGVDSIKQIEAFNIARRRYGLPVPTADLRVSSHTTLGSIAEVLLNLASVRPKASDNTEGVKA
ncbi:acyltransferase domain-containing protein [Streptomyces sp. NPDC005122]